MADEQTTETTTPKDWPLRIKLGRPIVVREKSTDKIVDQWDAIEFREPTAQDIVAAGVPVIVVDHQTGQVTFDGDKMTTMMARLSKIPIAYIATMETRDWVNCATMLQRFFLPAWERLTQ